MALDGLDKALRQMQQFADGVRAGAAEGLEREAKAIFDKSQQLVPVGETGRLKASGHVDPVEQQGDQASVAIVYDNPVSAIVHEDLESHHPQGQAKYVSQPVAEQQSGMPRRIAEAVIQRAKRDAGL